MSQTIDILAFAAHPDDAELSCAGTLVKQQKLGFTTGIVDLTEGELGTRGTIETRYNEAAAASKILKLSARKNLNLGDGFFSNANEEKLKVINAIRTFKPKIILANAPDDRHPDHGRASRLLKEATFLSGLRKIETFDEAGKPQDAHRPRLLAYYIQDRWITPSFTVDISDEMETKLEAIKAFKTQFFDPESKEPQTYISKPEFINGIKARAIEMGRANQFAYAEGFILDYIPGIKDLSQIF